MVKSPWRWFDPMKRVLNIPINPISKSPSNHRQKNLKNLMKSVKNTHLHFLKAADGLTAVGACEREIFNW